MKVCCVLIFICLALAGCEKDELNPEEVSPIESTSFVGMDKAWVLTTAGELWRTSDGGASWRTVAGGLREFDQIFFWDERAGLAVNEQGAVLHSDDGGGTWNVVGRVEPPSDTRFSMAGRMFFTDELNGWIEDSFSVWATGAAVRAGGALSLTVVWSWERSR